MSGNSGEKRWLIKNNNQIMGPFSQFQLEEEFKKGHISLFATACMPGQEFWSFIIVFPEFSHFADKTQLTQLTKTFGTSSLKTISLYSALGTQTKKIQDPTAPHVKEAASTPESDFAVQEVPYDVVEDNTKAPLIEKIKKKKQQLFIWMSALAVIAGVFFVISYERQKSAQQLATPLSFDTGRAYFSTGLYLKASQVWEEARQKNPLDKETEALAQLIRFQLDDDISQAGAVDHLNQPPNVISELRKIVKSLTQIKTGSLKMAKDSLNSLIYVSQLQDIKKAALANLAFLSAQTGDCHFFDKYKENDFENKHLFHFAFSFCLIRSPSLSAEQKQKAEVSLKKVIKEKGSYYQEAVVGLAYMQLQQKKDVSSLIKGLLDSSPYLTNSYYYDIFIDRNIYSWPQLLSLCEKIYSKKTDDKFFITFYAYCLARSKKYSDAKSFIERAIAIDSTNVLIKSIHAYITETINLKDQSALILGDAIRSNADMNYMLPYILQARFCENKKDWECAVENWQLVLKNRPDSLSSLGGLSYAKYHQGYYAEAREYMKRGLNVDTLKLYSPLQFVEKMLKERGVGEGL